MRRDRSRRFGRGDRSGNPAGGARTCSSNKEKAGAENRHRLLSLLIAVVCALAIAGLGGCAKKPAYKKLPKPPKQPAQAPRQAPPGEMPPAEVPTRPAAEPVRTNARPSTEDVITPQRQASMRLVERGKALIDAKDYGRAASAFRDAVNVDTSNGVAYYYLALADARLDQPDVAMGLLDKAEALLGADAEWMEKIDALRSELGTPASKPMVPSPIDKSF